jgi:hypothetical protein
VALRNGQTPLTGGDHALYALGLAGAVLWRAVVMGASAIALDTHLDGGHPRLGPCLRAALGRGISLAVAGSLVLLLNALLSTIFLANLWLGWFMLCAIPLAARRDATGVGAVWASRRELGGLGGKAAGLNALYLLLLALVWLNLVLGVHVLLVIGHALFDLDVAWTQRFLSPASPIFGVISVGLAVTVLEPVRHLTCALLVWDARIRREAHDIRAVFAELARTAPARGRGASAGAAAPPPGGGSATPGVGPLAALLVAALLGTAGVAEARPKDQDQGGLVGGLVVSSPADPADRLAALNARAGRLAGEEPEEADLATLRKEVAGLPEAERAKLLRFLDEGEAEAARLAGVRDPAERERAAAGLSVRTDRVIDAVGVLAAAEQRRDARAVARAVLAQPEFRRAPAGPASRPSETWWDRFLKWLFKPREIRQGPGVVRAPGLGGGFFQVLTCALLAAGATLIVVAIGKWLLGRRRDEDEGRPGLPGGAPAAAGPLPDPTTRTAAEWLGDADAAAARGDYRTAVRNLYLALLSALCRRGALKYDPARTNGEYVRSFRGEAGDRSAFRAVTRLSDAVIYGGLAVGERHYQGARAFAVRLAGEGGEP